jgi:hypothetical protein
LLVLLRSCSFKVVDESNGDLYSTVRAFVVCYLPQTDGVHEGIAVFTDYSILVRVKDLLTDTAWLKFWCIVTLSRIANPS